MHAQADGPLAHPGRCGRELLAPLQPAGPRQVHDQVQAGHVEVEELAVARRADDLQPGQRRDRRVVGLEDRDGDGVDARDHAADGPRTQEGREGFDLGELRHGTEPARRRTGRATTGCARR